jgi:hypothetical protein
VGYHLLAEVVMALHGAVLIFLVVGGFLAWRWPWVIWLHLAMATWGFSTVVFRLNCPLTYVEDWARRRAGEQGLTSGFIDQYLTGVIYPERLTGLVQALVAAVVLASWVGLAVRRRRHVRDARVGS